MTDETKPTPTKAQIEGDRRDAEKELAAAQADHADALKAMEAARGDKTVSMEQLVEFADAIKTAKANIDRKTAAIATLTRRIENYDVIAKADERNGYVTQIHDGAKAMFADDFVKALTATGVDRVVIDVNVKDALLVGVKVHGERLAGATRSASAGGNGRGFASAGAVKVDGTEYASLNRAYVALRAAADGVDASDVTPANSKSAEAWLTKHGHSIG